MRDAKNPLLIDRIEQWKDTDFISGDRLFYLRECAVFMDNLIRLFNFVEIFS